MQQTCLQQLADDETEAAGRVEMVHIGHAVWVDAREQRHGTRQFGEVFPVDDDAGRFRDGHEVNRVVGRSAGREQPDNRVDNRFLVDDLADRDVVVAEIRDLQNVVDGFPRQLFTQLGAGIHERTSG